MTNTHEDHERRLRSATHLLNEVVEAMEREGFAGSMRLNRARTRVEQFTVARRVTHVKAGADRTRRLSGRWNRA